MDLVSAQGGGGGGEPEVTAAERIERAREAIQEARDELAAGEEVAPPYAAPALQLVRAELSIVDRRLQNAARVLSGAPRPAA